MSNKYRSKGFVLPAIIALSLAISITAVTVMQVIVQTSSTLNTQYLTTVAKEAAEAGLVKAGHCLSSGASSWSQLTPSPANECTASTVEAPVIEQDNWKSTFVVTKDDDSNQQTNIGPVIRSTGTVKIYANNTRTGVPIRTLEKQISSILTSTGAAGNVPASPSRAVTKVASGGDHSCALSAGKVYCWGKNNDGQLGTADYTSLGDPRQVRETWPADAKATDVEVGAEVSCAVIELDNTPSSNQVWCWGKNDLGQLGRGSVGGNSNVPVRVQGLANKRIIELAEGTFVTSAPACVLTDEVSVVNAYCWGGNAHAQIGNDSMATGPVTVASQVQDPNNLFAGKQLTSISANNYSTCVATEDGVVFCWGWSTPNDWTDGNPCSLGIDILGMSGAPGCPATGRPKPTQKIPQADFGNKPVTKLAAGGWTNCAIAGDDAYCWGNNVKGVLGGAGGNTRKPSKVNFPSAISGQPVTDIDIDSDSACATVAGQLYCWGNNEFGQLGRDGINYGTNSAPRKVVGLDDKTVTSIGTGFRHECAVATGIVYCWGDDPNKLLIGNSSTSRALRPVKTSNPMLESKFPASSVAAGTDHTCAVINDRVFCWGGNGSGQLGNGDTTPRPVPEQVPGAVSGFKANLVTAGNQFSCASTTAANGYDQVYCWGRNTSGQLGNDTNASPQTTPTLVKNLPNNTKITGLSAGENSTCAIASGKVYCWGANNFKQLGFTGQAANATGQFKATSAVAGFNLKTATSISVGFYSACAVANGELYCWGRDVHGIVGVGDGDLLSPNTYTPTRVTAGEVGTKKVQSITVSSRIDDITNDRNNGPFACAVLQAEKNTVCWGSSGSRQLGDGTTRIYVPIILSVPYTARAGNANAGDLNNQSVSQLTAGGRHACSLSDNTTVVCWGNSSDGQLGDGGLSSINNPRRINTFGDLRSGGVNRYVTAISAGDAHTCAIADSAILCWGANDRGQLGTGDTSTYSTPKLINTYSTVNSAPQETGIRY